MLLESHYGIYLILAIAFLTAVTVNRGIYLYHKDQYLEVDKTRKQLYGNNISFVLRVDNVSDEDNKTEKDALREKLKTDEKELRIKHFRISLVGSILTMIIGHLVGHGIVSPGLMLGGLFNVIYSSITSWYYLEEAEKFSISATGLVTLIAYVIYKFRA